MTLKYLYRLPARIFKNLYFLAFLNGFLLASLFYFHIEGTYENELFTSIQKNINKQIDADDTQDSVIIKVMQASNYLLSNRTALFADLEDLKGGVKVDYLQPTTIDLMTARGACGSYSFVLARILQNYHYPVRIAQMKANGVFGAHNILEVKTYSGWVILDPTFDLYFTRPDNHLASFADIKNNWPFYQKQVPATYNHEYKYEDVRYTNWEKIPVLFPVTKKILDVLLGREKANTISLRVLFLRIYDVYFYITLVIFIPMFLVMLKRVAHRRDAVVVVS